MKRWLVALGLAGMLLTGCGSTPPPGGGGGGGNGDDGGDDGGGEPTGTPTIIGFASEPAGLPLGGGTVRLSWDVDGATAIGVSPDVGVVTGSSVDVDVGETKSFTLTATNGNGTTTATTTVLVAGDAPAPVDESAEGSDDLIDLALAAGTLDSTTALRYKVFALFGDPRLPAEYAAAGAIHGTPILFELANRFEDLPAGVQDELRPFMLPPDDPDGWYAASAAGLQTQQLTFDQVSSVSVPEGTVFIHWESTNEFAVDTQGFVDSVVAGAIEHSWTDLTQLMGMTPLSAYGPEPRSDEFHVFLIDHAEGPYLGRTTFAGRDATTGGFPSHTTINVSRISARAGLNPYSFIQHLAGTIAHELMHAIQVAFEVDAGSGSAFYWLAESHATWAEHYVYPLLNSEHRKAAAYLDRPELALDDLAGAHHYGSYLFHLLVQQDFGDQAVADEWRQGATRTDLFTGIDEVLNGNFAAQWKRFVIRNWNTGPFDDYTEWDDQTRSVRDGPGFEIESVAIESGGDRAYPMDLAAATSMGPVIGVDSLSAQYFHFDLTAFNVSSILFANGFTFDLQEGIPEGAPIFDTTYYSSELTAEERRGAAVQALIKRSGAWIEDPIDLTDIAFVSFCNDFAEESIEELVLVFSNSRFESGDRLPIQPKGTQPTVFASDLGCGNWTGSGSLQVRSDSETIDMTVEGISLERQPLPFEQLVAGETEMIWGEYIYPISAISPFVFGGTHQLESAIVHWQYALHDSQCTASGSGNLGVGDATSTLLDIRPPLTSETPEELSIYRSFFLNLVFMDPNPYAITGSCTGGLPYQSQFAGSLVAGYRNSPVAMLVGEGGHSIQGTVSNPDTGATVQLDLLSDGGF